MAMSSVSVCWIYWIVSVFCWFVTSIKKKFAKYIPKKDSAIKEITTEFIGKIIYNGMITVLADNHSKITVLEFSTATIITERTEEFSYLVLNCSYHLT